MLNQIVSISLLVSILHRMRHSAEVSSFSN